MQLAELVGMDPKAVKEEIVRVHFRKVKCARCGLVFGAESIDATGMYYHPLSECRRHGWSGI